MGIVFFILLFVAIIGAAGESASEAIKKFKAYHVEKNKSWHDKHPAQSYEQQYWDGLLSSINEHRTILQSYAPKAFFYAKTQRSICHDFVSKIERLQNPPNDTVNQIDISFVSEILDIREEKTYSELFSILTEDENLYPLSLPCIPPKITPPPAFPRLALDHNIPQKKRSMLGKLKERIDEYNHELESLEQLANERFQAVTAEQESKWNDFLTEFNKAKNRYIQKFSKEKRHVSNIISRTRRNGTEGLMERISLTLKTIVLPNFLSTEGKFEFNIDSGILIHEHRFPDLSSIDWVKVMQLKSSLAIKPATKREIKEFSEKVYPSLSLRLAMEFIRLDEDSIVNAVVINGWCDYTEKSTGQTRRAYCSTMYATKEQLMALNLHTLDPVVAFAALKGITAKTLEVTPIAPIMSLDTNDPRFVDSKDILNKMESGENLAAMDWENFEHLCRELFEKAFAGSGAEVKVTQASRDQGVDAVIFDPDPLRGGKIVIQAKRYTNTVDVSAVRDLYGALMNEGAMKGILVTTSHFGPDAYTFSKDKPITLINGRELLGLLEQHGYKFRIDLAEAKHTLYG